MGGKAHGQRVMFTAQPVRGGMASRHQASNGLRAILLQLDLIGRSKWQQVACNLTVVRCDQDEAFALRALFELENAQHGIAIGRIATQAIAGLGRIGDDAAALEVGFESSGRYS